MSGGVYFFVVGFGIFSGVLFEKVSCRGLAGGVFFGGFFWGKVVIIDRSGKVS